MAATFMIINFLNFANSILAGFIKFIHNLLLDIYCFYWLSNSKCEWPTKCKQIESDSEGPETKGAIRCHLLDVELPRLANRRFSFGPVSSAYPDSAYWTPITTAVVSDWSAFEFKSFNDIRSSQKKTLEDSSKST